MKNKVLDFYRSLPQPVLNIIWFSVIVLGFHYLFRVTDHIILRWDWVIATNEWLMQILFDTSVWIDRRILGLHFIIQEPRTMIYPGYGYIAITTGCSGLKQFYQVFFLFLLYPGPWRHKLWYIPVVILAMHLTNIFRIVSLSIILVWQPDYWQFSHDWILRPLFYLVLFVFWVIWVEKFESKNKKYVKPSIGD